MEDKRNYALIEARKNKGLSITILSELIGTSYSNYQRYEEQGYFPYMKKRAELLAQILNVPLKQIFGSHYDNHKGE